MSEGIVEFAERLVREKRATWQTLYNDTDSYAVETLMRSGHLVKFFSDYEGYENVRHLEALATIGSVYA